MTYWLVERYVGNGLHYWSAGARGRGNRDDWATDVQWATRFADEQSAEQVRCRLCDGEGRSTEHINIELVEATERALSTPQQLAETSRFMADNGL